MFLIFVCILSLTRATSCSVRTIFFPPHLNEIYEGSPFLQLIPAHPEVAREMWVMYSKDYSASSRSVRFQFRCEGPRCLFPESQPFPIVLAEREYIYKPCSNIDEWSVASDGTCRLHVLGSEAHNERYLCRLTITRVSQNELIIDRTSFQMNWSQQKGKYYTMEPLSGHLDVSTSRRRSLHLDY